MSVANYEDLGRHIGHRIVCVTYGDGANIALECETCGEVLLDYDFPDVEHGADWPQEDEGEPS